MPVTKYETGRYIIDVTVDLDLGTILGDIDERVLYCNECECSRWDDVDGDLWCDEWDAPVGYYDWCSRRVRRHDD